MKNVNESGRSMVEMLGVLAIIGVLSIGGIAGYTLAMNRYRANEALQAASLIAIEAIAQQSDNITVADLDGLSLPVGIDKITSTKDGVVTIETKTGYESVGKLIKSLSGERADSTCTDTKCQIDMRKGTTKTASTETK